jgi:hypothetical protein
VLRIGCKVRDFFENASPLIPQRPHPLPLSQGRGELVSHAIEALELYGKLDRRESEIE